MRRERIVPFPDEPHGVPARPVEDEVGPFLHVVAPDLSDFRVVEKRAPVAQAEHDGVHGSPREFVHAGFEFLLLDGRLVHVDERVTPVVVEHHAWLRHRACLNSSSLDGQRSAVRRQP